MAIGRVLPEHGRGDDATAAAGGDQGIQRQPDVQQALRVRQSTHSSHVPLLCFLVAGGHRGETAAPAHGPQDVVV
eukprot:CAMPEP_0170105348 /NCGR_PEP_ID=MMETSP0020_2-20130122/4710_1 /TAXON_ID=98059 /ORGANISM="Dinobryon sp., Strain UTEXLB2267" /LENGTH=74 /DNA_ID=CAMNT_0010329437 /DNA_START=131 /DNA_END=351 /DNA_ORIENTATION=-